MSDSQKSCPICFEDFNIKNPKHIPYKVCNKNVRGHYMCPGCIENNVKHHHRGFVKLRLTGSSSKMGLVGEKINVGSNFSSNGSFKCPICRSQICHECPNTNTIKYSFNRDFDYEETLPSHDHHHNNWTYVTGSAAKKREEISKKIENDRQHIAGAIDFSGMYEIISKAIQGQMVKLGSMEEGFHSTRRAHAELIGERERKLKEKAHQCDVMSQEINSLQKNVQSLKKEITALQKKKELLKLNYQREARAEISRELAEQERREKEEMTTRIRTQQVSLDKEYREKKSKHVQEFIEWAQEHQKQNQGIIDEIEAYKAGLHFQKEQIKKDFMRINGITFEQIRIDTKKQVHDECKGMKKKVNVEIQIKKEKVEKKLSEINSCISEFKAFKIRARFVGDAQASKEVNVLDAIEDYIKYCNTRHQSTTLIDFMLSQNKQSSSVIGWIQRQRRSLSLL